MKAESFWGAPHIFLSAFSFYMVVYDFPSTVMQLPVISGSPLLQARRITWTLSYSAFGISPSSNLSSPPTSMILKPLDTIKDENCQSFSNSPLESMMTERFSVG